MQVRIDAGLCRPEAVGEEGQDLSGSGWFGRSDKGEVAGMGDRGAIGGSGLKAVLAPTPTSQLINSPLAGWPLIATMSSKPTIRPNGWSAAMGVTLGLVPIFDGSDVAVM
jgi:hypothetical protein